MESFPSNYPLDLDELIVSPILVVKMMKNRDDRLKGTIYQILIQPFNYFNDSDTNPVLKRHGMNLNDVISTKV